jgi:ribonucleotide reductase beta subunit family protein with ferritin-like domain
MSAPFSQRIIAFACVEGIFFSGAFCAIFWLKERGILPGLCLSNEFISRDESLHTEFAVLLYSMLENKLPQDIVYGIVRDAVEIEDEFINESISCSMLGMNRDLMSTYIKFVADRLIIQLGYEPLWNVHNPFDFMDRIGLDGKDNFFDHTRNSNYARANIGTNDKDAFTFSTAEEF